MLRPIVIWSAVITISCIIVGVFSFGDLESPIRPFIVFWFFLVCPGMALVPLLSIEDKSTEFIIAIALSLAIDTAIATIMVYTGLWSPLWGLGIVIGICEIGVVLQIISLVSS